MSQELPQWQIASNKIKASTPESAEWHDAYAEYYEAMARLKGDSNGYYWWEKNKHREAAANKRSQA